MFWKCGLVITLMGFLHGIILSCGGGSSTPAEPTPDVIATGTATVGAIADDTFVNNVQATATALADQVTGAIETLATATAEAQQTADAEATIAAGGTPNPTPTPTPTPEPTPTPTPSPTPTP